MEELSSNLTISFLLLLSSSFPISSKSHYNYLCNLPLSYHFSYLFCFQELFLIGYFICFLIFRPKKRCVKNPRKFVKSYKYFMNQIYYRSISVLIILIFRIKEMKEKSVPMSSMQSLNLFSLEKCFPALIVIASIIIVLLVKENKYKNKNKMINNYTYSILRKIHCFSCYNLFSYISYQMRMQIHSLINDTQFYISVLENNKKYLSSVSYILICLTSLFMSLISSLFNFICQIFNAIFVSLFSYHLRIINKLMVSIKNCVESFVTIIIAQIQSFIHKCDRFEMYIWKNNIVTFYIIHLIEKSKLENYNLYLCQLYFCTCKFNQMFVQLEKHLKHLKIIIRAFLIRSINQKKLPISNSQFSFILKNSS